MKKFFYILPVLGITALSSCVWEMNALDKFLTETIFNIVTMEYSDVTVDEKNYTDATYTDVTTTDTYTQSLAAGTLTETNRSQTAPSGGITTFTQYVYTYGANGTIKFNEDGTFSSDWTQTLQSAQYSDETVTDPVVTFSGVDPTIMHFEGTWNWDNTTDSKAFITIEGMGTFVLNTEEKKDGKMVMSKVNNTVNTYGGFDVSEYTMTSTNDETITYNVAQ